MAELTFHTFNVRTAAVNGVNVIGHIYTLLRTCAAKNCDIIGQQKTKRDGTSEVSASGYHFVFSGDCSMVKGRKGQHEVELAIKEEIVRKAGEGGIAIECISARLLKARISIKSTSLRMWQPTPLPRKRQRRRRRNTWQPSTAP